MADARVSEVDTLLTTKQAAELLGQAGGTLRRWRSERTGPPYVQLSARNVRYRKGDVLRYIAERVRTPHVHAA